jgi:ABC-type Mn2+/Zn2+ transport system permease subunit
MSQAVLAVVELPLGVQTVLVAAVCSVSCAVLGCYLVLRRMSLLGDAISHAVLPGIAVAFFLSGQITGMPMVLGGMAAGMLTALLTQTIYRFGNVPEDASMGAVFTSLFAIGVVLITRYAWGTDLDARCVLWGRLELTLLDPVEVLGLQVPSVLTTMAPTLLLTLLFVLLLWKELKIASFDPALATAMGLSATLVHYLLMAMVAGVTVSSFEAVGVILVVAMLIVPAACAQLLTDRFGWMMVWSVLVAALSAVLGYALAAALNNNAAAMIAVVAGAFFLLAVFLAPRHGVLARLLRTWKLALRIKAEDILAALYREEEATRVGGAAMTTQARHSRTALAGFRGWLAERLLRQRGELAVAPEGTIVLTESGRRRAESLVRAHRLWEAYLGEHFELPLDHLHDPAERMEHFVTPVLQQELAAELHQPGIDPHGKPIPPPREGTK